MTRLICLLILITCYGKSAGQDLPAYIRMHAVPMPRVDSPGQAAGRLLADYRLIMVGEMHGTREPAQLVTGLAAQLAGGGDSVLVGFEIPPSAMRAYLQDRSESGLYASGFFRDNTGDGRANDAWAAAIVRLSRNPRIKVFFFDPDPGELAGGKPADSVLYARIKKELLAHPGWKMITLSGNVHNRTAPFRDEPTAGWYLANDPALNGQLCTLNHRFGSGTMWNNTGDGMKVRQSDQSGSDYATAVAADAYLLLLPYRAEAPYHGIFFTRKVTAAGPVRRD